MSRILIAGGPRVGKTALGNALGDLFGVAVQHTDDLVPHLDWTALARRVVEWIDRPGPWVIEGVAVARAVRLWLRAHPTGAPCETFLWSDLPKVPRTRGQERMAKGVSTVWMHVRDELRARGADVVAF